MNNLSTTLDERQTTHGDFSDNAVISQNLKQVLHTSTNWHDLTKVQKEALEMICHKMSRIVSGNADEGDHWRDIAGYSTLVEERLSNEV